MPVDLRAEGLLRLEDALAELGAQVATGTSGGGGGGGGVDGGGDGGAGGSGGGGVGWFRRLIRSLIEISTLLSVPLYCMYVPTVSVDRQPGRPLYTSTSNAAATPGKSSAIFSWYRARTNMSMPETKPRGT